MSGIPPSPESPQPSASQTDTRLTALADTQVRSHPMPGRPGRPGPSSPEPGRSKPSRPRLAWLDALRGIAALCVVYSHFGTRVLPGLHRAVYSVFDPGLYGVLVFFMISGYIVPASLERRGSIRNFWVSRLFRLFPLFAFAIAAALVLYGVGWAGLRGTQTHPTASVLASLFMLSDVMGGQNLIIVIWTLSYEMVFYLLLTALFTAGWHRRSGRLAGLFVAGALLLGGLLPMEWLSHSALGPTRVALAGDVLIMGGLAVAVVAHGRPRALGAWLAAVTALVLVALNERVPPFEGLIILALMFTGTLVYRAEQRQTSRGLAAGVTIGVFAAAMAAAAWHDPSFTGQTPTHDWVTTIALAGATFATGLAARKLPVPSALAWLGLVSYSVYLLHPLLLAVYDNITFTQSPHPAALQVAITALFFAAVLACAALTYYFLEAPMQRAGRRVAARLDTRLGPDRSGTAPERLEAARGLPAPG
jgi:peptidoglycan/LPS O-acetylase OafA/YrhL